MEFVVFGITEVYITGLLMSLLELTDCYSVTERQTFRVYIRPYRLKTLILIESPQVVTSGEFAASSHTASLYI